jgi:hypothetical protein
MMQFPELDSNANGYLGYTECSAKTQLGMVGMMRRVLIVRSSPLRFWLGCGGGCCGPTWFF